MTNVKQPDVTVNILGANVAVENAEQRLLLVAQQLSAGSATAGALYRDITQNQLSALVGLGSQLADGFLAARVINQVTPIDFIVLDDPAGSASVGEVLWSGTATENGEFEVGAASDRNGVATVAVLIGDDEDAIATKVAAAYASLTDCTVAVTVDGTTTAQNNFTCRNLGSEGDSTPLYVTGEVAGVSFTVTGFTGGAGTPTLTNVFDPVVTQRYQGTVQPGSYGTSNLVDFLDPRWNVNNSVLDGAGFICTVDSAANHQTALNLLNSQNVVYQCEANRSDDEYKGPAIFETPFARSCQVAALRALRYTTGENITAYVNAAGGANDGIGGPALGSLPFFNTPMAWPTMEPGTGFTDTEVEAIKAAGGFVAGNNVSGTGILLGEIPTTYKTDSSGNTDPSFKYLNYRDTSSIAREYMFNNFKADCEQSRLTKGDLKKFRNIHNKASITGLCFKYWGELSSDEYMLFEAGEEARSFFADNLDVQLNSVTGTVTINMKVLIVTQLRTIVANMQIAFEI